MVGVGGSTNASARGLGVRTVYLELAPATQRPAPHREDLDRQTEPQPVALDEVQRIAHIGSWSWDTKAKLATC